MKNMYLPSSSSGTKLSAPQFFLGGAIVAFLLIAHPAIAQFSYDFNGGTDPGWTHYAPGTLGQTFSFPANPAGVGNLAYELTSNTSGTDPGRVGSFRMGDPQIPDFTLKADLINWNNGMSMNMGVMARVQSPLPGTTFPLGYALVYADRFSSGAGGTDQLRLYKVTTGGLSFMNTTTLGSQTNGNQGRFGIVAGGSAPPDPSKDYQLIFTGKGNLLTGQIIDKSTGLALTFDNGSGGLTDRIMASDPGAAGFGAAGATLYNTGDYGVFGFVGSGAGSLGNNTDFTIDNFSIIPEPSTLTIAGLGLLGFFALNARRLKRSL